MIPVACADLAATYAAGSAVDPSWDVTEAEEQAAEAMTDEAVRARFAPVDETVRAKQQIAAVWAACNAATSKAMRAAPRGSDAKADAFMSATINVSELLAAIERAA